MKSILDPRIDGLFGFQEQFPVGEMPPAELAIEKDVLVLRDPESGVTTGCDLVEKA